MSLDDFVIKEKLGKFFYSYILTSKLMIFDYLVLTWFDI